MGEPLTGFGPGKIILLGEHAVVYGAPALAAPLPVGVRAWGVPAAASVLEVPRGLSEPQGEALSRAFAAAATACGCPPVLVSVRSELPLSVGLGSSAALAVAVSKVLLGAAGRGASRARVEALALVMEREFHGTPSGVDHTTSARGELLLFESGRARRVRASRALSLVVAVLGERPPTRETVLALRERVRRWPRRYGTVFEAMGGLSREGARAVEKGALDSLGDLMNVNQGLLAAAGLSSARVEEAVYALRRAGALGAKLTGAGGDGGAIIGLFEDAASAVRRLRRSGFPWPCFAAVVGGPEGRS